MRVHLQTKIQKLQMMGNPILLHNMKIKNTNHVIQGVYLSEVAAQVYGNCLEMTHKDKINQYNRFEQFRTEYKASLLATYAVNSNKAGAPLCFQMTVHEETFAFAGSKHSEICKEVAMFCSAMDIAYPAEELEVFDLPEELKLMARRLRASAKPI